MKKLILISAILFSFLYGNKISAQINFEHTSWAEILAKAKTEHKLIFVDAYTSWCAPCKEMANNVFTDEAVAKYYNASFVNAKINMEVGEGKDLAKLYSILAYPTFLFIDENRELLHKGVGLITSAEFIQLGKDAQLPEKQFVHLEKKYKRGVRDVTFMIMYLNALDGASLDIKEPLNAYFETQKEQDWASRSNWNIIYTHLKDPQSKVFNYMVKHEADYAEKYTADSVNNKIFDVYSHACGYSILSNEADSAKYFQLREEIKKSGFLRSEEIILRSDMSFYEKNKDYENYAKAAIPYIEKYSDNEQMSRSVRVFYLGLKDTLMLAKADEWIKKCCDLSPDPGGWLYAFASYLSQHGKKQEAVKFQRQAIELIKADPKTPYMHWIPGMEKSIVEWSK